MGNILNVSEKSVQNVRGSIVNGLVKLFEENCAVLLVAALGNEMSDFCVQVGKFETERVHLGNQFFFDGAEGTERDSLAAGSGLVY